MESCSFFSALATGLHDHTQGWPASLVHKKLIMHFCEIMFCNIPSRFTTIKSIIDNRHIINLNKSCVLHPAIKLWISRVNAVEPHLHHSPSDWYKAYPKLLKGLALRFIYYHRDYEAKPNRLFCMRIFSQLACEAFCCRIGLRTGDKFVWFYPLETTDYYLKLDIPTVIIQSIGSGQFKFCPAETDSLLDDTFELRLVKEDNMQQSFVLRKYSVENLQNRKKEHKNEQIGTFSAVAKDVHVILFSPSAPNPGEEECIYQVYTGDSSKTFYTLDYGKSLFVFILHETEFKFELAAQTADADQYLYFYLKHKIHCGVIVVCALTEQEAKERVVMNTKYTTFII